MNTDNIYINTQSSIKIILNKTIYFDPYKITNKRFDAYVIFITHDHYDHFDIDSINNIKNDWTVVVAPRSMKNKVDKIKFRDYIYLDPGDEISIANSGISVKAITAYNIDKNFHTLNLYLLFQLIYYCLIYF